MPYTVWSNGVLLGHSDLGFVQSMPAQRTGWFHATPEGVPIIEVLNDPRRVILHFHEVEKETLEADLMASYHRLHDYPLELRDESGAVIATEDIAIMDMEITMEFAREADRLEMFQATPEDELLGTDSGVNEPSLEEQLFGEEGPAEGWYDDDKEPEEWPRYQLMVFFDGHSRAMTGRPT